jgi:DNA-damage-inducible protein D
MKKELIKELFEKFEQVCYVFKDVECWSARELQEIFDYSEWRNFLKVIDKARKACKHSGVAVLDHFVESNKMIGLAKGATREVEDIALTMYACYLVAQNGDGSKPEIAFAQTYFAVQTRKQEIVERSFAVIRSKGDQALFGGFSTGEMKRKLAVPDNRPLADFLPTLTVLAKGFATES